MDKNKVNTKVQLLITGINGFVGQNLVKYFNYFKVYELFGLDIVFPTIVGVEKIYPWEELESIKEIDVLSKRIIQLASDSTLRATMGFASRKIAEKEFSIDSVIEKTLALYIEKI